jgi:hypothetical protein
MIRALAHKRIGLGLAICVIPCTAGTLNAATSPQHIAAAQSPHHRIAEKSGTVDPSWREPPATAIGKRWAGPHLACGLHPLRSQPMYCDADHSP